MFKALLPRGWHATPFAISSILLVSAKLNAQGAKRRVFGGVILSHSHQPLKCPADESLRVFVDAHAMSESFFSSRIDRKRSPMITLALFDLDGASNFRGPEDASTDRWQRKSPLLARRFGESLFFQFPGYIRHEGRKQDVWKNECGCSA